MNSIPREEKIQYLLEFLRTTPVIPADSRVLNSKYPNDDQIEHGAIILEMIALGLIKQEGVKEWHFSLDKLGVEVLNDEGYAQYELKRKQRTIREDEVKKQQIALLKKTNKMFWWTSTIGIIGGILGLTTFILDVTENNTSNSTSSNEQGQISIQIPDSTRNNRSKVGITSDSTQSPSNQSTEGNRR